MSLVPGAHATFHCIVFPVLDKGENPYVMEPDNDRGEHPRASKNRRENWWGRWIEFILNAIRTQAEDAIWRSERLVSLREKYREALKQSGAPTRLFDVIDKLFSMPAVLSLIHI